MNYKIYSLTECCSDEVRYIGVTSMKLQKRLKYHYYDKKKNYKARWIMSVSKKSLFPIDINLLEDNLTKENAFKKEKEYIKLFKSFGARLTNLTDGGEGGIPSNNTRKIYRDKKLGVLNPNYGKRREFAPNCKINTKRFIEIRLRYLNENISLRKLSKEYNISHSAIHKIIKSDNV